MCAPEKMAGGYYGSSFTMAVVGNDKILKLNVEGPESKQTLGGLQILFFPVC